MAKFIKMPKGIQSGITVNSAKREFNGTIPPSLLDATEKHFSASKWHTVFKNAGENSISLYSKKKRDLGVDTLKVKLVTDKYLVTKFTPSNSNDVTTTYYRIQ